MSAINKKTIKQLSSHIQRHLSVKLSPSLYYHNLNQTFKNVIPTVLKIARSVKIKNALRGRLSLDGLFHDIGHVLAYHQNESITAEMTALILAEQGCENADITNVHSLIHSTALFHEPRNLLEYIICDANWSGIRRKDFFIRSFQLRKEISVFGEHFILGLKFSRRHNYY